MSSSARGLSSASTGRAGSPPTADVEFAVADERRHLVAVPNDPLYAQPARVTATNGGPVGRPVVPEAAGSGGRAPPGTRRRRRSTPSRPGTSPPAARASSSPCSTPASATTIPTCRAATSCPATTWSSADATGVVHDRERRRRPRRRRRATPATGSPPAEIASARPLRLQPDRTAPGTARRPLGLIGATTNNGVGIASVGRNVSVHAGARARQVRRLRLRHPGRHAVGRRRLHVGELATSACRPTRRRRGAQHEPGQHRRLQRRRYIDAMARLNAAGASSSPRPATAPATPVSSRPTARASSPSAALRHVGTKVGFSDLGPEIAISAPGGNCVNIGAGEPCLYPILTTTNKGTTTPVAGARRRDLHRQLRRLARHQLLGAARRRHRRA